MTTAYLAADGFLDEVLAELDGSVEAVHERLVLASGPARPIAWAQNIWLEPERIPVASIGEAARALRARQRNWVSYPFQLHRRMALIEDRLPPLTAKPVVFGAEPFRAPLGAWTLLDPNTLLAAQRCSSPYPHGEIRFVEDRETPPNRAYLKLWEALTLLETRPGPNDVCLDLGSSPGGWSWVLQGLGARVISIDKAPLDPRIAALPNIEYRRASAFALVPAEIGPVDWLFCDVICYPERLLRLIETWHESGLARRMVCTIKFQGATDPTIVPRFQAIAGARLMHLSHNKHELTFVLGCDSQAMRYIA